MSSIFSNAIFLVPFRPDRQIRQGIKAIEAEETDSDDDIETNDDVDGLVFELAATCELRKGRHLNATFLSNANMITKRGW